MALLPEDPRRQRSLLAVIMAIAVAAAYYLYAYKPKAVEIVEAQERIEELTFQNETAEKRIGNLQELRDRLSLGERQFEALRELVPAGSEVPAIYEAIATEAQALNLKLLDVKPSVPVQDSGAYFMRQEWQMEIEGEYHKVGEFLTRVASFDRIVRPDLTSLATGSRTPSGRQLVRARFELETYVMPADTTPAQEGS
ncbi:MAG: type 4a pilus biogenesis protein PilO [Gemmatimonadota bacterium]